jgi:hypothetical protein
MGTSVSPLSEANGGEDGAGAAEGAADGAGEVAVSGAPPPGGGRGGGGGGHQFTKLSNLLMQLRKVCCHPFLFGEEVEAVAVARHGGDRTEVGRCRSTLSNPQLTAPGLKRLKM